MKKIRFMQSKTYPEITARIEARHPKNGKVTLIATPYMSDSRKRCPNARTYRRTVLEQDIKHGSQVMLNLVENFYQENAEAIALTRLTIPLPKKGSPSRQKNAEMGIFSTAYHSLTDVSVLYTDWAKSTAKQTQTYFERQILPRLDILSENITEDELSRIVDELTEKAQSSRRGSRNNSIAKDTVSKHLYRMDKVLLRLHTCCPDIPLVQFSFHAPSAPRTEQAKALPPTMRIRLAVALRNLREDPRAAGVALMFLLGLRTAEACAPLIKDFVFFDSNVVTYFVQYQIKDESRTEILKTSSAYRYTVGGPLMSMIIQARIGALLAQGHSLDTIKDMPLVSDPHDPSRYLDPAKLSAYGKKLLLALGYAQEALIAAAALIGREPDLVDSEGVTDVVCYILRRDWVSRALNICGMHPRDVDYLIGHKREDKSITAFNDPVAQLDIVQQLERCVLLPDCSLHPAYRPISLSSAKIVDIPTYTQCTFRNDSPDTKRIYIRIKSGEGGEAIRAKTNGNLLHADHVSGDLDRPKDRCGRPIILPPYSIVMLECEASAVENIDLSEFQTK